MAKLTTKKRDAIPTQKFGLPSERKYPVPDKGHAMAAKSRATQMEKRGRLTPSQKAEIDRKADSVLGKTGRSLKDR